VKKNSGRIFLIGLHLLFFCLALYFGNSRLKDSYEYIQQAVNLRSYGSWYCADLSKPIDYLMYSQRPPLYGAFLAITWWPFSGDFLILFLQTILSLFNCYLSLRIFETISGRKANILLFFLPVIFFATQFIYANMIMSEIFFQTFWLLAAYYAILFLKNLKLKDLCFHQLAITSALLIKPVAFLFPLISATLIVVMIAKNKIPSNAFITFLIPVSAIIFIVTVNYHHTSVIEYSGISRKLMINYNMPQLLSKRMTETEAKAKIDSVENYASQLSYAQRSRYIDQQCLIWIKEAPLAYLSLHLKGFFRFFLDHGRWDLNAFVKGQGNIENQAGIDSAYRKYGMRGASEYASKFPLLLIGYLLLVVIVNGILLFSFIRFLLMKSIAPQIRILFMCMVFYIALLTGPTGSARFRIPVYPLLLISFALTVHPSAKSFLKKG
jgi:hypothetical protein